MDEDDTAKLDERLMPILGGYGELYPSLPERLRQINQSQDPKIRERVRSLVRALDARAAERATRLERAYGLTPAETRVALHLADGGTVAGYAEAGGLSVGTVRSQLKSIFAKTGARRQSDLVRIAGRP